MTKPYWLEADIFPGDGRMDEMLGGQQLAKESCLLVYLVGNLIVRRCEDRGDLCLTVVKSFHYLQVSEKSNKNLRTMIVKAASNYSRFKKACCLL